jgi:hypothetical protein
MADKSKGPAQKLDLGLSAILSRAEGADPSSHCEPAASKAPTEILSLSESEGDFDSELLSLAQSKRWGVLVSRAEASFSSREDVGARLWWIRGHLGAFSLPVSLLAAPFETVCRHADDPARERHRKLIQEIGELMLNRLREVGDKRQEYAVRLALHQVGMLKSTEEALQKTPPRVPDFQSAQTAPREEKPAVQGSVPTSGRRMGKVWALAVGMVLAGVALCLLVFDLTESPAAPASEDFIVHRPALDQVFPVVRAREAVSNLGALYYSLSETPKADAPTVVASAAPGAGAAAVAPQQRGTDVPVAPVEKPAARQKDVVRTDGPIESPDFAKEARRSSAPQQARLPDPLFGRPPAPDISSGSTNGSANLSESVRSVITSTDVFSSPSYHARVLGRLLVGDEVNVEGQVGRWLRIRSRKGRIGFIYSQDVGVREDFRAEGSSR